MKTMNMVRLFECNELYSGGLKNELPPGILGCKAPLSLTADGQPTIPGSNSLPVLRSPPATSEGEVGRSNCQSKEAGMALVIALMIISVITGFGVAYLATTTAQMTLTDANIKQSELMSTVQSGFDTARAFLYERFQTGGASAWNTELVSSTNSSTVYNNNIGIEMSCTPCSKTHTGLPCIEVTPASLTSTFLWWRNIKFYDSVYNYVAEVADNDDGDSNLLSDSDNTLILRVWSFGAVTSVNERAQETMFETMVKYKTAFYEPTSAVVVGGSLLVYGSATIAGTNGNIQANGDVAVTGSASVSQNIYSTGTIDAAGVPAGQQFANSASVDIPVISPTKYASKCRYWLRATGDILDTSDNTVHAAAWRNWSFSGGEWSYTGTGLTAAGDNGGYYAMSGTNIKIAGSPGSAADPWDVTLISEGYIDVTGGPKLAPYANNVAFLAGGDLKVAGNASNPYTGLYAAHEQIKLTGTPNFNGVLLAEDAVDTCTLVSSGSTFDVSYGGNISVTYNGNMTTFLDDGYPFIKILGVKKTVR